LSGCYLLYVAIRTLREGRFHLGYHWFCYDKSARAIGVVLLIASVLSIATYFLGCVIVFSWDAIGRGAVGHGLDEAVPFVFVAVEGGIWLVYLLIIVTMALPNKEKARVLGRRFDRKATSPEQPDAENPYDVAPPAD
jgi:hypothetical protein